MVLSFVPRFKKQVLRSASYRTFIIILMTACSYNNSVLHERSLWFWENKQSISCFSGLSALWPISWTFSLPLQSSRALVLPHPSLTCLPLAIPRYSMTQWLRALKMAINTSFVVISAENPRFSLKISKYIVLLHLVLHIKSDLIWGAQWSQTENTCLIEREKESWNEHFTKVPGSCF